ncbi:lasso peptide biosynthesis B2 protein [Sphingomonas sp. LHG3443-2]|uniref:lasso peptide biosynthesis B2 protein n=1 Tax=Sphingomonas sp. LHG3443-2 TaxID=2804639 RepID=UPI003CEC2901
MRVATNSLLARRHWGTIVEAGLALAAASAATRLLPFKRYIRLGARPLDRAGSTTEHETSRIMDALGRRAPFRAVCLQRGLALQWMLRRRGIDAILHYGVQMPREAKKITAHVWVSVDGRVLLGAPQHEQYTEVARYPGSV